MTSYLHRELKTHVYVDWKVAWIDCFKICKMCVYLCLDFTYTQDICSFHSFERISPSQDHILQNISRVFNLKIISLPRRQYCLYRCLNVSPQTSFIIDKWIKTTVGVLKIHLILQRTLLLTVYSHLLSSVMV